MSFTGQTGAVPTLQDMYSAIGATAQIACFFPDGAGCLSPGRNVRICVIFVLEALNNPPIVSPRMATMLSLPAIGQYTGKHSDLFHAVVSGNSSTNSGGPAYPEGQ